MRRFLPKSRMGIFAAVILSIWVLKTIFAALIRRTSPGLALFLDLLSLLVAIPAIYYSLRLFQGIRSRLLWKIRRRLILANIFIGAIPVFLVISIFWFSALLFYYQLSYYLISNQIGIQAAQIQAYTLSLREGLENMMSETTVLTPATLKQELDADSKYLLGVYPSASITLSFPDASGKEKVNYFTQGSTVSNPKDYRVPFWLADRGEFTGLVIDDTNPDTRKAKLFLRAFVSSYVRPDLQFNLEVSVPFDHYFLGRLKAALGQDFWLAENVQRGALMLQISDLNPGNIIDTTFQPESTKQQAGISMGYIPLFPTLWTTGMETKSTGSNVLMVELSTARLVQNLFHSESDTSKRILGALETTVLVFLIVEVASIVIGIILTKSITNAVHSLDRGTEFVKRGDFSHRIVVRSEDQLGALASSFNQMTEYVQDLVKERVKKERLERELEIAKEVQERLFPNDVPKMGHMDLAGICLPARTVSGDYYDFLPLGMDELGLALGDICGKGISAALLMTNLQATLRGNVMNARHHDGNVDRNVAELVERLNTQIYSYTSANKFASFFYALYNEEDRTLTYCNAGHNPPLYFKNGDVRRLNAGGTVVGIFADSKYDQETIQLNNGDLLVAYTDGITESINEYGEEFGESRLIQLIQENRHSSAEGLKEAIVSSVLSWTFAEERDDDMTLVIAKIIQN